MGNIYGKFLSNYDEKTSISNTSAKRNEKMKKSVLLKESNRKQKLNENILEDKLEKIYNVLDDFNIKYYDNIETSHQEQDGEEWYDYLGVFGFDEEVEEKVMNWIVRELEKELKYSEVYPNEGDEGYQGFTITLGSGDEDDLFESKKSKMDEDVYDVEHLVLYPDDLTDDEVYSRNVLLGSLADISDFLSEEIGDAYIVSMSEKPKDKEDPYMGDCVITLTFEGDDVDKKSLEKIREFLGSETPFEDFEIIGDNKISFLFQPKNQ